jgi:hypothetical protein
MSRSPFIDVSNDLFLVFRWQARYIVVRRAYHRIEIPIHTIFEHPIQPSDKIANGQRITRVADVGLDAQFLYHIKVLLEFEPGAGISHIFIFGFDSLHTDREIEIFEVIV